MEIVVGFAYLGNTCDMTAKRKTDVELQKEAALLSLIVGIGMLIIKTIAYFLTNSTAILSDALESIVHVAATGMAFYSVILSAQPADRSHPYGHGKIEFFSAGIEGGLIVIAALVILYEAARGLVVGHELVKLDTGILLTAGAAIINLFLGWFLIRRGKKTHSITLVADGRHVLTDSWTSFGVIAGLVLVKLTGLQMLDPLVAIVVAVNILIAGYKLVRISVGGLMDESDADTLHRVTEIINRERTPPWINVHHLRIMRSGPVYHIDFHLTIPFYWSVEKGHTFQKEVVDKITMGLENSAQVLIHLDPCKPEYCKSCRVEHCRERKSGFEREPDWKMSALLGNSPGS